MRLRKVNRKTIRHLGHGVQVVADVNAVVAGDVGESGPSQVRVSSRSRSRIVQRRRPTSAGPPGPAEGKES